MGGAEELQSRRRPCSLHLHNKHGICHSPEMGREGRMKPLPPGQERCPACSQAIKNMPPFLPACAAIRPPVNVGSSYTDILEHRDEALTSLFILCKASRWSGSLVNFNTWNSNFLAKGVGCCVICWQLWAIIVLKWYCRLYLFCPHDCAWLDSLPWEVTPMLLDFFFK